VNFDEYARMAVDLVNARLDTLDDVRAFFGPESWQCSDVSERDITVLRKGAKRLREIFEYGSAGRDTDAVAALNLLLEAHPVQPRISGHEIDDWHMHVTSRGSSVSAEHMAGAVWGLAVWLCEYGSARFGVCADERCGNVYLDTSSNCCRRFCSERCATRSHVAAHRARKRAAGIEPTGTMTTATTQTATTQTGTTQTGTIDVAAVEVGAIQVDGVGADVDARPPDPIEVPAAAPALRRKVGVPAGVR
jgi:predicted RNA-binding Zn ribbon-like protein